MQKLIENSILQDLWQIYKGSNYLLLKFQTLWPIFNRAFHYAEKIWFEVITTKCKNTDHVKFDTTVYCRTAEQELKALVSIYLNYWLRNKIVDGVLIPMIYFVKESQW